MGYTFDCDGCGDSYHEFPPFAGEFTEEFLKTLGGKFAVVYNPGQKVTLCSDCMELQVLAGKLIVCKHCGWTEPILDAPDGLDECPVCEGSDFGSREVATDD